MISEFPEIYQLKDFFLRKIETKNKTKTNQKQFFIHKKSGKQIFVIFILFLNQHFSPLFFAYDLLIHFHFESISSFFFKDSLIFLAYFNFIQNKALFSPQKPIQFSFQYIFILVKYFRQIASQSAYFTMASVLRVTVQFRCIHILSHFKLQKCRSLQSTYFIIRNKIHFISRAFIHLECSVISFWFLHCITNKMMTYI